MSRPSTAYVLWDYQADLVEEVGTALETHNSVVLQLPTGGGKTRIAVEITRRARAASRRVWFVCHRREIIRQTHESFDAAAVAHGVVAAGFPANLDAEVQVCSVGSLARRAASLGSPNLIIWDECHHVAAKSWSRLKAAFPDAHHLGLTATPTRLDGKGLKGSFAHLIIGPSTRRLIDDAFLSSYRLFAPTIPDLRGIKTTRGDYDKGALGEAMSKAVLVGDVVEHYQRHVPGKRAIVFASSVKGSQAVAERFDAAGIPALHIDGSTPEDERDAAVRALADGSVKVLTNVEIFTEGFDLPTIDAVILLRPTKSLALFHQMVGRGLRTAAWKAGTVILDHAGLVHEHGLPDDPVEWSLDGFRLGLKRTRDRHPRLRRCPECSAVHEWAAGCPECSYAYLPADRTMEEVYGELREVGKREGYETGRAFSLRMGFTGTAATEWKRKGMPVRSDGLVPSAEAEAWFKKNVQQKPKIKDFESVGEFSKRTGLSKDRIRRRFRRGLPTVGRGQIPITAALAWLKADAHPKKPEPIVDAGLIRKFDFADRMNVSRSMVSLWVGQGLPTNACGLVDAEAAEEWVKHYRAVSKRGRIAKYRANPENARNRKITWANPELRSRHSETLKSALANPEIKTRMSESRKRAWARRKAQQSKSE